MQDTEARPRNPWSMALVGFILGAPALMLWLGRFRLSLVYFLAVTLASIAPVAAVVSGLLPMPIAAGMGLLTLGWLTRLPLDISGFAQALAINRFAPRRPWYSRWFIALPAYSAAALALAFLVRTFLYQPFNTPSASSVPNLVVGDMFFASKLAYRTRAPERGDLAVFKLPKDGTTDYVKRIIGLPGDQVHMKNGRLSLNGAVVERRPVTLKIEIASDRPLTFYRETLPGGRSYVIAELSDQAAADNTIEFAVPPEQYFMLGDNRDNSADSRHADQVGYVPRANIFARFALLFWNTQGLPLTGRPEETR